MDLQQPSTYNTGFNICVKKDVKNIMPDNLRFLHDSIGTYIKYNNIPISNIRYRYFPHINKLLILIIINVNHITINNFTLSDIEIKIITLYNYIKLYCILHPNCKIILQGIKTIINTSGNFIRSNEILKDIIKTFINGNEYLTLNSKYSNILVSTSCFLQSNIDVAMVLYNDIYNIITANITANIITTNVINNNECEYVNLLLFGDDSMNIIQYLLYHSKKISNIKFNIICFMHCDDSIQVGIKNISNYNNINIITTKYLYLLNEIIEDNLNFMIDNIIITAGRKGICGNECNIIKNIMINIKNRYQIINISCKDNSCLSDTKFISSIPLYNNDRMIIANKIKYPEMFANLGDASKNGYCETLIHFTFPKI